MTCHILDLTARNQYPEYESYILGISQISGTSCVNAW